MTPNPVISIPHNFETDDTPEILRLKLGEMARTIEDLFNRQISVYVTYSRKDKRPTFKKGDILMDFSANRGFATLQQWDGKKLVPLSLQASAIVGYINLITQGIGSGSNPNLFLRSDGADHWVLDKVDLLNSGKGSGTDATKFLKSDGSGGWAMATPAGGGGGGSTATLLNNDAAATAVGDVMYVDANDSVKKARADIIGTKDGICMATAVIASGATGVFSFGGVVSGIAGLVANTTYYLSAVTAGLLSSVPPSTLGLYNVRLGKGISTTEFNFCPERPILL